MPTANWQILLLDPDADYAQSLKPFLEAKIGRLLWADSEQQAEKILAEKKIDLLVLEIILAEPDAGLRFCRKIKADQRFADLPVFILSSADERFGLNLKSKLDEPGYCPAKGFLDKATQPPQIAECLQKFLRSQRS